MPDPNCPLCGAPLPLVLDATTGRCPKCKFEFGRMLDIFQQLRPEQASSAPLRGDSLDTVETVMQLEEDFDINVPPEELENVHTIEDAIRLLEKYRRRPPGEQADD